jgi:hypothetical protein
LAGKSQANPEGHFGLNTALGRALDATELGIERCEYSNGVKAAPAGFTEAQMLEIVLLTALHFLIHLVDDVPMTDNDTPAVTAHAT